MTPQQRAGHFALLSKPDRNPPPLAEETRRMEGKQGPLRVLVVEDDFLIAMQTEVALTAAGFEVVGPATTAEEAVALAQEAQPLLERALRESGSALATLPPRNCVTSARTIRGNALRADGSTARYTSSPRARMDDRSIGHARR